MTDDGISSLRAAAHPLRLRMLSLLTGAAMSAAEVARELDTTHANASYHLRVLRDAGLIVDDGEERIRGGVAKRYRYRHQDEPAATRSSNQDLSAQVDAMCAELKRRYAHRRPGKGTFTDAELWVDPDTWEQALDLVTRASMLLHEEARRPRTAGTMPVNLTMAAFRMEQR
jgi:DNA-binding transcriptional ArsR family regulator